MTYKRFKSGIKPCMLSAVLHDYLHELRVVSISSYYHGSFAKGAEEGVCVTG